MQHQIRLGQRVMRLVAGATVAGAALVAQTAYAAVVTVDFSGNAFSTIPFNIDGVYINILTGATGTTGAGTPGWDLNPYFSGTTAPPAAFRFFTPTGGGMVGALAAASVLAAGATVGPASSFVTGAILANATGTNAFGFRFVNEGTGATHYGYAIVSQSANPPAAGAVRLLSYAYESTAATPISVVPEPSSWLMMLGGLAAVGTMLRKRSA